MNKRKSERFECLVPVDGPQNGTFDRMRTVDFSKGGVGFISEHDIPVNAKIGIELMLDPDSDPVLVVGRVQWSRFIPETGLYRVGMMFTDVVQDPQHRLSSYFTSKD